MHQAPENDRRKEVRKPVDIVDARELAQAMAAATLQRLMRGYHDVAQAVLREGTSLREGDDDGFVMRLYMAMNEHVKAGMAKLIEPVPENQVVSSSHSKTPATISTLTKTQTRKLENLKAKAKDAHKLVDPYFDDFTTRPLESHHLHFLADDLRGAANSMLSRQSFVEKATEMHDPQWGLWVIPRPRPSKPGNFEIEFGVLEGDPSNYPNAHDNPDFKPSRWEAYSRHVDRSPEYLHGLIAKRLKPGQSVLDVGSGSGRLAELLPQDIDYTGLDSSAQMNQYLKAKDLPHVREIHEVKLSPKSYLPVADESQDHVISNGLFSYLDSKTVAKFLKEAHRVLKPGGTLTFSYEAPDRNKTFSVSGEHYSLAMSLMYRALHHCHSPQEIMRLTQWDFKQQDRHSRVFVHCDGVVPVHYEYAAFEKNT